MKISFTYDNRILHARIVHNFDTFPNVISILLNEPLFNEHGEIVYCRDKNTNHWFTQEGYEIQNPPFFGILNEKLRNLMEEAENTC